MSFSEVRAGLQSRSAQPLCCATLAAVLLTLLLPAAAQDLPATPALRSDATEVLVDVVVRDKKGRLIRGLQSGDVTVREDGVDQSITSFREVLRTGGVQSAEQPAGSSPAQVRESVQISRQIRLVSLVYDRLSPEGRRLSRQASLDFLGRDLGPNVYYGVFTIDRGFRVLQQYTADRSLLKTAIDKATSGERSSFTSDSPAPEAVAAAPEVASTPGQSPGAVDGGAFSAAEAARMAREMADMADVISREDLGRMSVFSLWAVVKELQKLPGRKTALYFAEGLQMPTGLVEQFKSMISSANLANVSIYAIDARGITTASDQSDANRRLSDAATWSRYARSTQQETAAGNKQEFRTFDRAVDSLRANQQNVMMELAESTGGFLIANTNDLRPNLERLSQDFNTYYELTYRPKNPLADGRFRAISVKVNRAEAVVQARNGYFALPRMEGLAVYPYEVSLLTALGLNPLPNGLEFRSRVLQFRPTSTSRQSVLVFDMPLKQIAFTKDDAAAKYRTHISVLALVKDEEGRVVTKLSRDVPLTEPWDRLAGFQQGRFIVTQTVSLPPGRYTVESVAADREGQRIAAKRSVLVVQPAGPGLGISEMVLVRRVDQPALLADRLDPFQLESGRIVPTLADTVPGGYGRIVSLFFVLYPDAAASQKPGLIMEVIKDSKVLSKSVQELPPPDASGAIPFVANMPLAGVQPGQYQFRATLMQAQTGVRKSIYVNVE